MPWFVNWNDYRANFEAEASRILGHRVHVAGAARATILPSPSLAFSDVEVADEDGHQIMTVERFEVVIELMPLLQGEIRVVSMKLEKPVVHVAVDDRGGVAWLRRTKAPEPFDPEKVVLDNVSIQDGSLLYDDARTGVAMRFDGITADVSARALIGPWHVDGFYLDEGSQVGFRATTGRVLDDGSIRVKADFSPARWPVTVGVDGPVGIDPKNGITYRGTYALNEVVGGDGASSPGWRSEGAFELTGGSLAITKAVLSNGPVDRPLSVAGTLSIEFGRSPSFAATAEARQIDLDRSLGGGPSEPADVAAAADSLVASLSHLPVPGIPGSISINVPAIVVGGRVIEGVALTAEPARGGWTIRSLNARLPGQARLAASGVLTTTQKFGFVGETHLAVAQPATFATWWRGREQEGSGRLLAPFDLSGRTDIAPGRIAVDDVEARIGDATITGSFAWSDAQRDRPRELGTDLKADRIDFVQVKALAELLAGRNLSGTTALADKYTIRLAAGSFAFGDVQMRDVAIDAAYADDVLIVVQLAVGDLGGASFRVTSGRIDDLTSDARGHLEAKLEATTLDGLVRIVERFWPDTGFARWFRTAAPALAPAVINARVRAPPRDGGAGIGVALDGVAGSTTLAVALESAGKLPDWRSKSARMSVILDSPDSVGMARQVGMLAVPLDRDSGAHIELHGNGIPAEGIDTTFIADVAGLAINASGKATVPDGLSPAFTGSFGVTSDDFDPIIAMAGLGIPGAAAGTGVDLDGRIALSSDGIDAEWPPSRIGASLTGGRVTLAPAGGRGWRIGGDLVIDEVDLGWIASLGLGFAPVPTGDPATPWSKTPFISPVYGQVSGGLQIASDRIDIGDLSLSGTKFALDLQPQRIDLNLTAGQIAGGMVTGGMSVHNVGGNANLAGRFDLKGAALESFVWQRDGRSVATGVLDLSANFEATGRSPAGLISTMTGGGVITVRDGQARYVNPGTVRQLVRASDLGQQFTEDALKISFGERIDADDLSFTEASGAFAIVAGAVRLKNLPVKTAGVTANGNAVIDLNAMTLDSDWSLVFDPVDNKVTGIEPKAGIVFRGPIAAPARTIDVLPFAAYLNEREAARMNEIIALDLATRAEKERLGWLSRRLSEDAAWRAEQARIAAEREAARRVAAEARAAALEAFHVNRETYLARRHVEALAALADRMDALRAEAETAAAATARIARAERANADAAAKALAAAVAAEQAATTKANAAAAALAVAQGTAEPAAAEAAALAGAAETARAAQVDATAAEATAQAAAAAAARDKADADAALKAATARANAADAAAARAETAAAAAATDKENADKAAAVAIADRDTAAATLAEAEAAVGAAQVVSDDAATNGATLAEAVQAAEARKAEADAAAQAAADAVAETVATRDAARDRLDAATADAATAEQSARAAADTAAAAARLAETLAAGAGDDEQAAATANAMRTAAAGAAAQAATRQAAADAAAAIAAEAQAAFDRAQDAAAAATDRAADAAATATAADDAVKAAVAGASRAATAKDTALRTLSQKAAARDAAAQALAGRAAEVERTAAAAAAAATAATAAVATASTARAEAEAALAARTTAAGDAAARAAAAAQAAQESRAATAARATADGTATSTAAKAKAAGTASAAAARTLAARSADNEAAQTALRAATDRRIDAEAAAHTADMRAIAAEATAATAGTRAEEAAAAAAAARQTAERAAADVVSAATVEVSAPPPKQGAAVVPVNAAVAGEPVAVAPVPAPAPRPRRAPLRLVPEASAAEQPLNLVPR